MVVVDCSLQHVGASGAVSGSQSLAWIGSDTLVYASHALVYITSPPTTVQLANGVCQAVRRPLRTLRTSLLESTTHQQALPVITVVVTVQRGCFSNENEEDRVVLVTGFSNGTIQAWEEVKKDGSTTWMEHNLLINKDPDARSVTTLDAVWVSRDEFLLVVGTSSGAVLSDVRLTSTTLECVSRVPLMQVATATKIVQFCVTAGSSLLLFVGTAAPKHNRIHVFTFPEPPISQYAGYLAGHEDWINSLAYGSPLLASGSQDARIRLWRFRTIRRSDNDSSDNDSSNNSNNNNADPVHVVTTKDTDYDDDEGESRLHWIHEDGETSVTLEALLYGHEESVTGVAWHPAPADVYNLPAVLISSGMDRIILLWAEGSDGVWLPLSRVGSAGGILGGSVGSSLLGYNSVTIDPMLGHSLIGHAYGGSLHVWNLQQGSRQQQQQDATELSVEEKMQKPYWEAGPSVTGHFASVTDMCWDSSGSGDFFYTVSADQTCRLWGRLAGKRPEDSVWLELARPQVHGHDISAVTCVSTPKEPLLLVTGADEKEVRLFQGPKTTASILQAACGIHIDSDDRVDRAFIPSLGLSNKASAVDAAEEDQRGEAGSGETMLDAVETMTLPQERDLGAVSLWPETRKLFGHNTEIYALASTNGGGKKALVASSAKARESEDAQIRLWDAVQGTCVQVLKDGHKSTVATMCFSPNNTFLVTSGKDRRLCLWERVGDRYDLRWAKDGAHKRIVWSVDFHPFDETIFASGSRDGSVKIWKVERSSEAEEIQAMEVGKFSPLFQRTGKPDAVTALSFAPISIQGGVSLLAIGLESGRIEFWTWNGESFDPVHSSLVVADCHVATVTRLAWRVGTSTPKEGMYELWLASSSVDHGCRVYNLNIHATP